MLPLLERIVGHLERVRRVAEKDVVDREVALDYDRFEAFALRLFERLHDEQDKDDPTWRHWDPSYVRAFADELHWVLLDGVAARWSAQDRFGLIEAGLSRLSSRKDLRDLPTVSPSRARLLESLVEAAERNIGHSTTVMHDVAPWNVAVQYCNHLALTDLASHGAVVNPAGSLLVRLRGLDRLRWLLALETSMATSARDPWCIDLGSVRILAAEGTAFIHTDDVEVSIATLDRWAELGALRHEVDGERFEEFSVTQIGREILGELAHDDATSFRILARSLLEDDRERVLTSEIGTDPSPDRAAAATLRHARMVAHEVRNTLLPIQYALKKVWASPAIAATDLSEQRHRIDEGFARLHRFIDDSLRLTPIAAEEAAVFAVMEAIDEARRQCVPGPEGGIQIEAIPASADPRCRGHRGRLVVAFLNLLRNAVQVGGAGVRIRISVDARAPRTVFIRVQDDGPGIPETQRDTLFMNGVSHRDGGSGHGLSFVKLVIEQEMGGRVRLVSPSDEAGACFELELTTEEDTK